MPLSADPQQAPPPLPTEPPPPLPPEPARVLLGRDADFPKDIKSTGGYSLRAVALLASMFLGFVFWTLGANRLGLSLGVPFFFLLVIAAGVFGLVVPIVARLRARGVVGQLPKKLPETAGRLRVVGKPARLAPFVRRGEVRDETFEPLVLFAPRVSPMPTAGTALLVITTIAVFLGLELLRTTTTLPIMRMGWFTVMAGIAVGMGLQMLVWPTYTRVTPGRLDVMRFRLGSRKPQVTTVNLRNAQVFAHLNKLTLVIKPDEPSAQWTILNLRGVWNPAELTHAVMRGAISSAPTPPLPDDQLIG